MIHVIRTGDRLELSHLPSCARIRIVELAFDQPVADVTAIGDVVAAAVPRTSV
jgi:hypothetical protein